MKLIREVCGDALIGYPRRYLLLKDVSDEDAKILSLCNFQRATGYDEEDCEAWMVM